MLRHFGGLCSPMAGKGRKSSNGYFLEPWRCKATKRERSGKGAVSPREGVTVNEIESSFRHTLRPPSPDAAGQHPAHLGTCGLRPQVNECNGEFVPIDLRNIANHHTFIDLPLSRS
jgi:hypothetical protein